MSNVIGYAIGTLDEHQLVFFKIYSHVWRLVPAPKPVQLREGDVLQHDYTMFRTLDAAQAVINAESKADEWRVVTIQWSAKATTHG